MSLKNLFNFFRGYRWSLEIIKDGETIYTMYENSVLRMIGYVMRYFRNGSEPVPPWKLYLTFRYEKKTFELKPKYFTTDGNNLTPELVERINSIDPGFKVPGREPVFIDVKNNKRLKITSNNNHLSIEDKLASFEKYKK